MSQQTQTSLTLCDNRNLMARHKKKLFLRTPQNDRYHLGDMEVVGTLLEE